MSSLAIRYDPLAVDIFFTKDTLHVLIADGREISVPLIWFPRLQQASDKQRKNWRLIGSGLGIHWEAIDEDISVENLFATHH